MASRKEKQRQNYLDGDHTRTLEHCAGLWVVQVPTDSASQSTLRHPEVHILFYIQFNVAHVCTTCMGDDMHTNKNYDKIRRALFFDREEYCHFLQLFSFVFGTKSSGN